jgi:hypothetical protein
MPYVQLALFVAKLLGVLSPYAIAPDQTTLKVGAVDLYIFIEQSIKFVNLSKNGMEYKLQSGFSFGQLSGAKSKPG